MGWRRSLRDPAFARPAGIFGVAGDDHTEWGGDDVQLLADIFANHMTLSPAGASDIRFNDDFNPFEMLGQ